MKAATLLLFIVVTTAVVLGRELTQLPAPPILWFRPVATVQLTLTRTEYVPEVHVVYKNSPAPKGKYAYGWGPIPEGWNYRCINIDQVHKLVSGRPNCQ